MELDPRLVDHLLAGVPVIESPLMDPSIAGQLIPVAGRLMIVTADAEKLNRLANAEMKQRPTK